jgi:hypothetical protein
MRAVMSAKHPSTTAYLARGVAAGLAGTVGMTAVQKFVEMPLSGRGDSYAPARFVEAVLPIRVAGARQHHRLNYLAHYAIGATWGGAYGLLMRAGSHGRKALAMAFGIRYAADVLLSTALGVYQPSKWTARDVTIDVADKFVQVALTGLVLERVRTPRRA